MGFTYPLQVLHPLPNAHLCLLTSLVLAIARFGRIGALSALIALNGPYIYSQETIDIFIFVVSFDRDANDFIICSLLCIMVWALS